MPLPQKRTKIVCTIGPASEKKAILARMVRAGMNVARLNFSHGTYTNHRMLVKNIRAAAKSVGVSVALLADLQGPKVRVGILPKDGMILKKGAMVVFCAGTETMRGAVIPVPYDGLARDLTKGDRILLDDGLIEVVVLSIRGREIRTRVVTGGTLTSHKGFNVPTATLRISAVTEKDLKDLVFALRQGVDFVALSFVRTARQVLDVRKTLNRSKRNRDVKILVKIEKHEALTNFDAILAVADGIMVARGDLAIETPAEEVPVHQKEMIEKCLVAAKPVIVATQMLDSMIRNPRPTRAEVSDVANAVIDHTDATMLSGETASGAYPIQSVEMMARVIEETESSRFDNLSIAEFRSHIASMTKAMAEVARMLSETPRVKGIVVTTMSGTSAQQVSRFRPEIPILACTPNPRVARQLLLSWGVTAVVIPQARGMEKLVASALRVARKSHLWKLGNEVIVVTGSPVGKPGTINQVEIVKL